MDKYSFQVRVTGILIENKKILLVKQKISPTREWSLPGGRAEAGEQLEDAITRELYEETGLKTKIEKLLYLCDKTDSTPSILHITFLLRRVSGEITLPTNEFDENPISDVKFAAFHELTALGFSEKFVSILENDFPNAGNYMGSKENIGL
ncbi:MAG: NUDIX hydrolase [Defluviitaleaceae bacterium]|nr:NUDIX hydrolase [Defluviitaleaceae bacterium]